MYLSFLSIQDTALVYQDKEGKVTMREECTSEGECKQVSHAHLRYDLPNGFTYLQLGRDFINLFYLNICHLKTIHRTPFLSFWIFDLINKIEHFHFIHI